MMNPLSVPRWMLIATIVLAFENIATRAPADDPVATKPNILMILVDDLGYGDVGVFHQNLRAAAGDRHEPWHMTPSLDRMANEGMTLPHHYCPAPVCAPSRASLLLGVHQGHANVRDNQFDKALENNHTLATVLKRAGYATAAIGKYGLQGEADGQAPNWPAHPNRRGFDEYYGYIRHVDGHEHYPKEGITRGPKEVWENDREVSDGLDGCYTTDLFTARAKHYLSQHVKSSPEKPFFLYLAYDTPHAALTLPAAPYPMGDGITGGLQWIGEPGEMINTAKGTPDSHYHPDYANATWDHDADPQTPEVAWPDVQKRYASLVRRIDDCIGDVFAQLRDLELDSNTLVVFTTDNGPSLESYLPEKYAPTFFNSFGPFDGTKRDLWEGGVRVGALARWPARIRAGSTSGDWATAFWDWLPTFAEAAGAPIPARSDGVSLIPLLTGEGRQSPSTVYIEYFQNGRTSQYDEFRADRRGRKRNQMQLIRQGNFVGVRYDIQSQADDFEIYDVVSDPGQRNDLRASQPALQQQMKTAVTRLRRPDAEAPRPYDDTPIAATTSPADASGLSWQLFSGPFDYVPATGTMQPKAQGVAEHWNLPLAVDEQIADDDAHRQVVVYRGFLTVPKDDVYHFHYRGVDRAIVRLHGATVIDADAGYEGEFELSARVRLQKGRHPILIQQLRFAAGESSMSLQWSVDGGKRTEISSDLLVH